MSWNPSGLSICEPMIRPMLTSPTVVINKKTHEIMTESGENVIPFSTPITVKT